MAIRVKVVQLQRAHLALRWVDPFTGKSHQKTAGTSDYEEALRAAGRLEDELRCGRYTPADEITWDQFRDRFDAERAPDLSAGGVSCYDGSLHVFEREMEPQLLSRIDSTAISLFRAKLFKKQLRDATIAKHLRHLKAALRWAVSVGMMATAPKFDMPRRGRGAKLMKGRPLTEEEFEKFLAAVPAVVGEGDREAWEFLLRGLWYSGLRLAASTSHSA